MATRMVVCPECGADVPYGRLSCVTCGTLLASVAGAAKRTGSPSSGSGRADAADDVAAPPRGTDPTASADPATTDDRPMPPVLRDWTGPAPESHTELETPAASAPAATIKPPRWVRGVRSTDGSTDDPDPEPKPDAEPGAEDDDDAIGGASAIEDPILAASPAAAPAPTPLGTRPLLPMPGGYVAPAIVPSAATTVDGRPATASAIAAASIADGSITSVPAAPRPDRWFSTPAPSAPAASDASSTPGKAGLFSDLPFRAPGEVGAWVVAVGALLGVVAFFLHWSENGVMGSLPSDTYFGRWGLANPANLIPMGAALAMLLITVIPNRIPRAIRGVALPIAFGGWFLGIGWSYATGPFGLGWGVDALTVGGVLLVIGGVVAAWRLAPSGDASADRPPE